jgi:hypothetical protein
LLFATLNALYIIFGLNRISIISLTSDIATRKKIYR